MHEGDPYRLRAIREIVAKCGVRAFVETGAWKGDTIIWAAETFPHLDAYMTCEVYAPHFYAAWERTRGLARVSCSPTPSPQFLEDLPADLARPALFYLERTGRTTGPCATNCGSSPGDGRMRWCSWTTPSCLGGPASSAAEGAVAKWACRGWAAGWCRQASAIRWTPT
jgi:hypothetical protein